MNFGSRQSFFWNAVAWLGLLWLMYGCGKPLILVKPGATDKERHADVYTCGQEWERSAGAIAFRQDPIGNAYYGFARQGEIDRCMLNKGWVVAP